jgi:hypothetical protein
MRDRSDDQNKDAVIEFWRMRLSYPVPEKLYEVELREPLKSFASKKYTVGSNGLAEFEMFSDPHVAAGDSIQIDAYETGEKIFGKTDGDDSHENEQPTPGLVKTRPLDLEGAQSCLQQSPD